jgi:glycosyltransferase involved in cell wall biosynthesis
MRILLVASRSPWPPRRGDQLRALQASRLLAAAHEVTLLVPAGAGPASDGSTSDPPAGAAALPPTVTVARYATLAAALPLGMLTVLRRGLPLQNALFHHPALGRRLAELAPAHDLVILQLSRLAAYLPAIGQRPLLVDLIDSLALNLERRAAADRPWRRPLWRLEARRLARAEGELVARAAVTLVVAGRDRDALARRLPAHLHGRLGVVPLAMAAGQHPLEAPPAPAPRLVFTGNLGYFPNDDGARWLCTALAPALAAAGVGARLLIAGDRPTAALQRAAAAAAVELVASPPDLVALLAGATLALAPLAAGSGQPIKVLEAWAAGVPVIATPWAAAGTTGIGGRDLLIAAGVDAWVAAIRQLLADPARRQDLARHAAARLAADYSEDTVRAQWLAAVARAVGGVSTASAVP